MDIRRSFFISIFAPIDLKTLINPHLVGLSPTFFISKFDSFAIKPATIKNDADEKSPATSYFFVGINFEGMSVILLPKSCDSV